MIKSISTRLELFLNFKPFIAKPKTIISIRESYLKELSK